MDDTAEAKAYQDVSLANSTFMWSFLYVCYAFGVGVHPLLIVLGVIVFAKLLHFQFI